MELYSCELPQLPYYHSVNKYIYTCQQTTSLTPAMATKAPKPWKLTEDETFSSFTSWKNNLLYSLSQDDKFKPFLGPDSAWQKQTSTNPNRGFTDGTGSLSARQQSMNLSQMLGLISQWVPHYLTNDITKNSTGLESIWQFVRKYYGFQQSETNFMKFSAIVWEEGERPERLYQRILAHLQDNLLKAGSKLKHDGEAVLTDEDISPTVERLAVLRWMELLHPSLPSLVQRTFAYDLQRMTLKDIQPQIVDALDGFLEELKNEEIKASRSFVQTYSGPRYNKPQFSKSPFAHRKPNATNPGKPRSKKECRLCKAEGRRFFGHHISECNYISHTDKLALARSCLVDPDDVIPDLCDQAADLHLESDDEQQ